MYDICTDVCIYQLKENIFFFEGLQSLEGLKCSNSFVLPCSLQVAKKWAELQIQWMCMWKRCLTTMKVAKTGGNVSTMGRMLHEEFPKIVWTPYASHSLDLFIPNYPLHVHRRCFINHVYSQC